MKQTKNLLYRAKAGSCLLRWMILLQSKIPKQSRMWPSWTPFLLQRLHVFSQKLQRGLRLSLLLWTSWENLQISLSLRTKSWESVHILQLVWSIDQLSIIIMLQPKDRPTTRHHLARSPFRIPKQKFHPQTCHHLRHSRYRIPP